MHPVVPLTAVAAAGVYGHAGKVLIEGFAVAGLGGAEGAVSEEDGVIGVGGCVCRDGWDCVRGEGDEKEKKKKKGESKEGRGGCGCGDDGEELQVHNEWYVG